MWFNKDIGDIENKYIDYQKDDSDDNSFVGYRLESFGVVIRDAVGDGIYVYPYYLIEQIAISSDEDSEPLR